MEYFDFHELLIMIECKSFAWVSYNVCCVKRGKRLLRHSDCHWFSLNYSSSSSVALQPGVGLGLLDNTPPGLSIPCSVSPFVYSHLSQVRGHVIQPPHFWSFSSSCCVQLSVQHIFFGIAVSCILSM